MLAADAGRWALAGVLVVQTLVGLVFPPVLQVVLTAVALQRTGERDVCIGSCDLAYWSLLPWAALLAAALLQNRVLRLAGSFPYGAGQTALMLILPGYNLYGSVELFAAQGRVLERLGSRRGLELELRAAASVASGLAVALGVIVLRVMQPLLVSEARQYTGSRDASDGLVTVAVLLLVARLYVIARLQIATRALVRARAAGQPIPELPPAAHAGLPGSLGAVGVAALAVLAGASALDLPAVLVRALRAAPPAQTAYGPTAEPTPPRRSAPPRASAGVAVPTVPRGPSVAVAVEARSEPPLAGGRTAEWWAERLEALRASGDAALYRATVDRARANGLLVEEVDGKFRVSFAP